MSDDGKQPQPERMYLGDGVHVTHDDWGQVMLTVSNGVFDTNRIFLDPSVLRNFEDWVARARAEKRIP